MAYRVMWALLGQSGRCIDGGPMDGIHDTYGDAVAELSGLLRGYAEATRSGDGIYWIARRSADADLEVRVWIEDLAPAEAQAA
jgi:hypothetical protein